MTDADIAALDAAEKAATPANWEHRASLVWSPDSYSAVCEVSEPRAGRYLQHSPPRISSEGFYEAMNNGKFIALARNLTRPLLDERQAMQKRIAELEEIDQQYCRVNMELTHENAALHERIAELEAALKQQVHAANKLANAAEPFSGAYSVPLPVGNYDCLADALAAFRALQETDK